MKKKKKLLLSVKKTAGLYIFILGIIFFLKIFFPEELRLIYILLILISVISLDLIIRAFYNKKRVKLLIPGFIFLPTAIFFLIYLIFLGEGKSNIKFIWPIIGIFPGLSLIIYYLKSEKRSPSIIIPGIFLIVFSGALLLFNLKIFNFSFQFFLIMLAPTVLTLSGMYLLF
ncbi:MAG TPA: hypothetical protein P5322_00295 [Spirochaetota bacterium]|nr:hypothetical protein [Spirochaetota bacterium]